jgi:hypothetical protein
MVFRDPDYVNPVTNAQPGQIVKPAVIMVGGDPASGGTQPSGTVTFMTYGGPGCTGAPTTSLPKSLGTGFALGDATTVANNGLSYQVAYAGDTNYAATTGACVNLSLVKLDTATTLRTSVNPGTAGQAVTLTASVSSTINITPTGTVSFTAGGVTVTKTLTAGTTPYTAVVTHVATFPAGANTISATYNGDNNYNSSSSSGVLNMNMPFFLPFVNKPSPGVNNPSPGY